MRKEKAPLVQRHFCKGFFIGSILMKNVFIFSEASAAGYSEPFPAGPVSEALLSYAADLFWGDSFSYEDPFSAGLSSYAADPSWAEFFSYAADP